MSIAEQIKVRLERTMHQMKQELLTSGVDADDLTCTFSVRFAHGQIQVLSEYPKELVTESAEEARAAADLEPSFMRKKRKQAEKPK